MTRPPRAGMRIADDLARRIAEGDLGPGDVLSRSKIAAGYGVTLRPVTEALQEAGRRGLIARAPGIGWYVLAPDGDGGAAEREPGQDPAKWVRVARTVEARIAGGRYRDRLPAKDALAAELGVSIRTTAKAYRDLAAREVVCRAGNSGYYVRGQADPREWVRVTRVITGRIIAGELRAGAELPSKTGLAAELGVSPATIQRAFASLAARGIIRRELGKCYRVASRVILDSTEAPVPVSSEKTPEQAHAPAAGGGQPSGN